MPNIFKPKRSTTASSVPTTGNLSDGELAVNLTDRKIFVRNGASIVTVADSLVDGDKGDITVSSSGASWTIDSGVVTNAKLANVTTATIKGRTTAGTGSPEDLTGTQATALLDTFTTSLKGLAPASGGGTANFLRADGTWAAPTATVSGNLNVGIVTATSFVKSGGTSSQFLKADGSVDSNTYITSASVGNGTLSLGVSGTGLSGTASFTANQSGNTTFTVTSNATSANTASTIVARDGSGNFIAGIITATTFSGALSGNATSATTATSATSATSAGSVTNSVTFNNAGTGAASGTTFNGSSAVTISHNTIGASPLAGSTSLTTTGTVTTGTWSGSFGAVSGANLTNLTAGNLSGTIPSGVLGNSSLFVGTTSIALNRASASQSLTGVSIDGNAGTVTNGFYTTSSFNLGTTSIAVNRASAAQSLTGINIDGSSGSCTGNAATATILQTTRTIWGQNFNGSANVTGALSGATDITATGTIKGNQVIGGTGSAIGSAGLIVNGTTGDNDSQLIIKKPSQSSFGVLSWDGQVFLSANIYYENSAWVHSAPTSNTNNNMLVLAPGTGVQWYASNNSTGSWNVAGGTTLWNDSGVWQRSLSNTLTLNTSGTGLSGSTTYNNSGAATFTVTSNAQSTLGANTIVSRDGSNNFSAGTITATLSGNASTATTLATIRTIWGQNFDGSANVTGALSGATTGTFSSTVSATAYTSTVATGTAPFTVSSTTKVTNLNADLLDGIDSVGLFNNMGQTHSTRTSFDASAPSYDFGFRYVQGNTNGPGVNSAAQYYSFYTGLGSEYPATGAGSYGMYIAIPRNVSTPYLTVRYNEANSLGSWQKISAGYADSAGSSTSAGSVTNSLTFNNAGSGAASGTTFNGSAAQTISYNTIGASPLAGSASLTTTGTVTSGTWSGSFGSVSGANLTNLTAGNLTGTIPSAVLGNSVHFIGTTSIALNRASASQSLTGVNIDGSSGSCTGNAATATTLATARTINNVSFNGSANIVVPTIFDSNYYSIMNPGGAQYVTQTSTVTGAIAITFPVGMTNSMVRMTIKVYEYATNESFEIHCGGYTYNVGNTWANNPFAYITGHPDIDRRFSVRFGYTAAGRAIVYIGELASTWSYPQVFVTEVQVGYSGASSTWSSGWAISFVTAAFENVTATISDCQTDYRSSSNTAKSLVYRDASNNFSAGTITATLSGNASTATTLATIRTIWGQNFDGSANVTGALTGVTNITASGTINLSADQALVNQNNGNAAAWYGRILSKNSTSDKASFLGTYGSIAGVFAHNNALNAWADLYVNTVDGSTGGAVRMPSSVLINGNQAIHAGNYNSYAPTLTGTGASGSWGISITGSSASCTGNAATATSATSAGSVTNSVTFNNGGAGAASGTTFNGSAAQTISYNTIGASPLAGSTSLTTTGTVTTGTWSASFGAVSGANLTNLTAGNLSGTIPSGVLGNSSHFIGTTSIALNRASAAQSLTGVNIDGSSGSCTGNAATATTLATARNIGGTSFNGSADITPFRSNTLTTVDGGTIQASSTTYAARSASSTPQQYAYGVNWEFKNAAVVGGAGNYAGLLTLAPWLGTTASTGDPTYQLAFSPAAANSTAIPTLQIRAGIDATWGSWATILHSSSTLTAGNLSGTIPSAVLGNSSHFIGTTSIALNRGSGAQTLTGVSIDGNAATATSATSATSAGSVTNSVTFNNAGTGAASGTTFNGSAAQTISYNTIGASPLAGSTSLTTTGTVTTGTWSGSFGSVSGANLTNLTAGNLSGTIPSGVLGNSAHFIGTTSIALNRASAAQALTGITSIDGSAATLTTTRTIWGQNFNGSANVTGALTGVTDITATGNVAVDGAFRAESSNSTERFDIYYNETTDSLDFDYLTA